MAKWANSTVLNGGLDYIKNNVTQQVLIKAYAAGDSYATVMANAVAAAAMAPTDMIITGAANNPRVLTFGAKSAVATANSGPTPDNHIAFTDGVSSVLVVTDETSDQQVFSGNMVNFPSNTYTSNQPI
ncbi:MAG TPA: hypothetical protein VFS89_06930 [Nitrosospira sp.]|nr:hypothetical protein [Nitrosospira sp.]